MLRGERQRGRVALPMPRRILLCLAFVIWTAANAALVPAVDRVANPALIYGWMVLAVALGVVISRGRLALVLWSGSFVAMSLALAAGLRIHQAVHARAVDDYTPYAVVGLAAFGGLLVLLGIAAASISRWVWRRLRP